MKRYPLGKYGLSIVLACLFVVSWIAQTWFGWRAFQSEQSEHGQVATWLGESGYLWHWGEATFENWQSEFLQLLTFVVLTALLIHHGSHESKDTDDEVQEQLNRIERRIEGLERASVPSRASREPREAREPRRRRGNGRHANTPANANDQRRR